MSDKKPFLTLRKYDAVTDWYIIEKHEEAGEHREWDTEPKRSKFGWVFTEFCSSARFSQNADVEGDSDEMYQIADAIDRRLAVSFKRCAVDATGSKVEFWSPRNSREHGVVSLEDAQALSALIKKTVPKATHVLAWGLPVCMFVRKVPGEWPAGHDWVNLGEAEEKATCESCKEKAKTIVAPE